MKHLILFAGFALALTMSPAQARTLQVERSEQPYLFGWKWEAKPSSMTRVPRTIASHGGVSEDQPLRVQKKLPSYRHLRSGAQIHWEIVQEMGSGADSQ